MNESFHLTEVDANRPSDGEEAEEPKIQMTELIGAAVTKAERLESEDKIISLLKIIVKLQESYIETLKEMIQLQKEKVNVERLIDEYKKYER